MKGVRQELVRQKKAITAVLSTVRQADESHNFAAMNEEIMKDLRKCGSLRDKPMMPIGGRATGLGDKSSDLDLVIHINTKREKEELRKLSNYYRNNGYFKVVKLVLYAKIPIVRVVHLNTNIEVDISLDTPLNDRSPAIKNTRLMTAYRRNNQGIAAIFKLFKFLLRGKKVASAATSGISSYGFSILFFFFLRKKKYIRFIDPLSFEEEKNNDIIYEHEGIIFLSFLRFIFSQDITENVIQLRDDPAKTAFINSNLDMPRIEAVYEQKDLTKALNSTNFIDLKCICLDIYEEIKKDFGLSNDFNLGKLFHKNLSREDRNKVSQFLQTLKKKIDLEYV